MLYVLDGLSTNVILGIDFLKWFNPSISWVDFLVGMLCLAENNGICKSSSNLQGGHVDGVGYARMTTCSNGILCKKKVLVSAK